MARLVLPVSILAIALSATLAAAPAAAGPVGDTAAREAGNVTARQPAPRRVNLPEIDDEVLVTGATPQPAAELAVPGGSKPNGISWSGSDGDDVVKGKQAGQFLGGGVEGTGIRRAAPVAPPVMEAAQASQFLGGTTEGTGIRRAAPVAAPVAGAARAGQFIGGSQEGTGIRRKAPMTPRRKAKRAP
jgi:hypothetical protein